MNYQQFTSVQEISEEETISITQSLSACFSKFDEVFKGTMFPLIAQTDGLILEAWQDELGRLRMWASNIGAHRSGLSSLDFRLRDASHIRQQIVRLLGDLLRRLQDARDVLAGDYEYDENDDSNDDDDLLAGEESQNNSRQQRLLASIRSSFAKIINRLFQMSMLVRKPAQHDLVTRSKNIDVSAFEQFDFSHVRDKFPKADESIVRRLARAITRRRRHLKYREIHAAKLKQGIGNLVGHSQDQAFHDGRTTSNVLSDTVATNLDDQIVDISDQDTGSEVSQTSYASTLLTGGSITIPAPPKESQDGAPFECPYCYFIITIQNTKSWNAHVFADLQPYSCTDSACPVADKLFTTRREWLDHCLAAHSSDPLHEKFWDSASEAICPLCMEVETSSKSLTRHLARHLQELALFVLPRDAEESDVSGGDSTHSTSESSTESHAEADADRDIAQASETASKVKSLRELSIEQALEKEDRGLLNAKEKETLRN